MVTDMSPSPDNYTLGKGVPYFNRLSPSTGLHTGELDLGNASAFSFSIAIEKLEHYSSRGGLSAKDKEIVRQITPSLAFTLDEINVQNVSLLTLGEVNEISAGSGTESAEAITAFTNRRTDLAHRGIGKAYSLPYDDSAADNVAFVPGEIVSGATGAGIVLAVTGGATSGTLTIALINPGFIDDEVLTGSISGSAEVNSTSGEVEITGTPVITVLDQADPSGATVYTAGVDYIIDASLKDDKIGRIRFPSTTTIPNGSTVYVFYGYDFATYSEIQLFKDTQIEGSLRFVSDNPAGNDQEVGFWKVSLTPAGDTALIGDDWSTLGFTGEVLKDEAGHPNSPYGYIIMD